MKPLDIEKLKVDFTQDVEARKERHLQNNFHYLMYKGISMLNWKYSQDTLNSLGLQIHVPRTFMTIEAIRPDLSKPLDISLRWRNRTEKAQAERASKMLKGEWQRSHGDDEKAKAEFDALLYGTGFLLGQYEKDTETTEVFKDYDKEGKPIYEKGEYVHYDGMTARWIDPYYIFPDRKAKTYQPRRHNSPRHTWVYSIWDYEVWEQYCKDKGYKTEGMEKGGHLVEYDQVRRRIDALFINELRSLKTRDNGQLVQPSGFQESPGKIHEDSVMVLQRYEANRLTIISGANWTVNFDEQNELSKKEIPIYAIKDYDVPGELDGIGESEVIRWQQYEENKIHNLSYLQVLLNTVKRYGIMEELLVDPTDAKMSNPLKPIRLKFQAGAKVSDAVQMLNQHSTEYPQRFLEEVKNIGQSATGQTDYSIAASDSQVETLGEAEIMKNAGNKRIRQKIQTMEDKGVTPLLEQWLASIPRLYSEEMDFLLNDGTNNDVKFLPYNRSINDNVKMVALYAAREGIYSTNTVEDIFKAKGYSDVVFVSDLIGRFDVVVKTALASSDRQDMIRQYREAIADARANNMEMVAMGKPPRWNIEKLVEDLFRQFPDIIEDISEYQLDQQQGMLQLQGIQQAQMAKEQPTEQSLPNAEPATALN